MSCLNLWVIENVSEHPNIRRNCLTRNMSTVYEIDGPGSVVGITTGHRMDGPGIESRWGARFSAPVQSGPGAIQPSVQWVPGFPGSKERSGRDADFSLPSSAVGHDG
jgi:hypothetical protein